ncbi:MAG: methyltransferase domain-containing protein [Bryobacterales bacterium]
MRKSLLDIGKALLPAGVRSWLVAKQREHRLQWPRAGAVDFGQLRRLTPISPVFGHDRGKAVDRHYIEAFLEQSRDAIHGRVLELGDATYTKRYGGDRVRHSDVLHVTAGNPEATIVADLTDAPHIPDDCFDCIVFTQSLQMIFDYEAALRTLYRILKPGGVLLITSSGISKIARRLGRDDWGEYWRFTTQGMQGLLEKTFPGAAIEIQAWGNVLSATAYLHGLAAEELTREELDALDPDFEVIVSALVRKAES